MAGWIKLHRSIQSHWLWESEKPFDKRSAWIDILLLVNHDDNKMFFDNEIVFVKRGEHITSEPKLAERWGWSRTKVRNFLNLLEKDGMIKNKKEERKRTRLIVLNYNDYQGLENNERTRDNTTAEQEEDKTETGEEQEENINKNDKNDKNDKEDIYILSNDEKQFLDILAKIENYPLDRKKDLEMYKTLGERYPVLDLVEAVEQWKMYKLDKPLKENSNARSQVNTSFRNYVKWHKCLKEGSESSKVANISKTPVKTKFHNFQQRTENFSENDLEKIARMKRARG